MVRSILLVVTFSFSATLLPCAQDPLQERLNRAVASHALMQAYFDANGEPALTLELAFPHLAGAPLADPLFLAARGRTLAARRDACARERFNAGDGDRAEPVRAACDAEDAAAALEERLLSALTVGLELAPGFTDASVELARRPWREARERASRYATDAVGAFVLHRLLLPRTEFLALLALIWVGWALLGCVPAAIRLMLPLLGRALDPLEADSEPPADVLTLGERTSNWFLRWRVKSAFKEQGIKTVSEKLTLETAMSNVAE